MSVGGSSTNLPTMATPAWLTAAVEEFGAACKVQLAGPGDREAAIRVPLANLLSTVGKQLRVAAVFHDEVRDPERQVRPDYAVAVNKAITGYVEVKAPSKSIDPSSFRGHDKRQWERQRDLPNLLYTNGVDWWLWRDGEQRGEAVSFGGGTLAEAGAGLHAPEAFEQLITDFLQWRPNPITSVGALVRAIAPLTRLLRGEVLDQLDAERRAIAGGAEPDEQPFLGLARNWRALLFPEADDQTFADGYAQAVTFALLLARTEGLDLANASLHEVGKGLSKSHSLMGKALQLLADDVTRDFKVTLDILVRVVGAVDWPRVRKGKRDTYLHLYEDFLELYDNELRKQTGTYYTPIEVVEPMVRLAEEALTSRLGLEAGYRDDSVQVVDPAMGTGTFLLSVLRRIADHVMSSDGGGSVRAAMAKASQSVTGFELQMGPFAVAELRTADLLAGHEVPLDERSERLYVTNTLDDPYVADTQLTHNLMPIARSRRKANEVKAKANVTVVIGNPPYRERAEGMGGWVEAGSGSVGRTARGILDDFREDGNGRFEYVLKNLYVYFWRWATWKVWESTPKDVDGDAGVVCFISTAGYMRGPGFRGMRRYLRQWASEGWIIDLTPEGQTPDVPTRIFPGVRQPLAIGLFVRRPGTDVTKPASIMVREVTGRQRVKFAALAEITLDGDGWQPTRTDWTAPLTPAAAGAWDEFPALNDLMPWSAPGVKPNRTWVYAPARSILDERWRTLISETDPARKAVLFKETVSSNLSKTKSPLAGFERKSAFVSEAGPVPTPVRVGFRSFDRQWVIPDARLMHRESPDLWAARVPGQVFVTEQHAEPLVDGPGLTFTELIPDMHHFNNRGGRALPFLNPDGTANLARGLATALSDRLGLEVTDADVLAYIAGIVSHPAFTATFAEELNTPGIRVPLTTDPELWETAVKLGERVLWLHTYGAQFVGDGRPAGSIRLRAGDPLRIQNTKPITTMPSTMTYDAERHVLMVGDGEFGPVSAAVWDYAVGGKNVLKSWFNYRKAEPGGRKGSPLDDVHVTTWPSEWNSELLDVISVLQQLVDLEPEQAEVLAKVLAGDILTTMRLADPLDGVDAEDTLAMTAQARPVVKWPGAKGDRTPRYPFTLAGDA